MYQRWRGRHHCHVAGGVLIFSMTCAVALGRCSCAAAVHVLVGVIGGGVSRLEGIGAVAAQAHSVVMSAWIGDGGDV